jgi:AcrR family transcriptional regulator
LVAKGGGNLTSRRDREKEFKKQLIAEAAFQLFSSSSFEAVTVEDIARRAEFGKGTLYLYFDSKEEILIYIINHAIEELAQDISALFARETDVREALNQYMSLQYDFYRKYHYLFFALIHRKFAGTLNLDQLGGSMCKLDAITELVAGLLQRGTQEGIFTTVDSHKLARVIKNILKGFSLEALERGDPGGEKDLELIKMVFSNGIIAGGEK